jgi:hypothetical protein
MDKILESYFMNFEKQALQISKYTAQRKAYDEGRIPSSVLKVLESFPSSYFIWDRFGISLNIPWVEFHWASITTDLETLGWETSYKSYEDFAGQRFMRLHEFKHKDYENLSFKLYMAMDKPGSKCHLVKIGTIEKVVTQDIYERVCDEGLEETL